jgi:hypothetical protein
VILDLDLYILKLLFLNSTVLFICLQPSELNNIFNFVNNFFLIFSLEKGGRAPHIIQACNNSVFIRIHSTHIHM